MTSKAVNGIPCHEQEEAATLPPVLATLSRAKIHIILINGEKKYSVSIWNSSKANYEKWLLGSLVHKYMI